QTKSSAAKSGNSYESRTQAHGQYTRFTRSAETKLKPSFSRKFFRTSPQNGYRFECSKSRQKSTILNIFQHYKKNRQPTMKQKGSRQKYLPYGNWKKKNR